MLSAAVREDNAPDERGAWMWSFVVEGPLVGHKCSKSQCFSPRYQGFKKLVRLMANLSGVPQELDPKRTYTLCILVHWVKKAKVDTVNVYKSLEDGLWGKDRRCLNGVFNAVEFSGVEKVEVVASVREGLPNVQGVASVNPL